jgi:hypothetical protein
VWTPVNPQFREQCLRQMRETMARLHNCSPRDERAVRTVVFSEFERLIDTMGIALKLLLGFIGSLTLAIGATRRAGWGITSLLGTLPLLGPLFKDTSGRGDIHLQISTAAVATSRILLEGVGLVAGLLPAIKASRLVNPGTDPTFPQFLGVVRASKPGERRVCPRV